MNIAELKAMTDLAGLVQETHPLDRSGKVHCPFHDDTHPSCHIYRDGFKCFACGAYGDHLDWLERVRGLSTAEAVLQLARYAQVLPAPAPRPQGQPRRRRRLRDHRFSPVSGSAYRRYGRQLSQTRRLPAALEGRGLTLADALELGLAAQGDDALIPITGPDGKLLAIKRRFHLPSEGAGGDRPRYAYTTSGHGSPAWCSPGVARAAAILVIEGELNGMVAFLALREAGARVGVLAPAGSSGSLYPKLLTGRLVWIYADGDEAGDDARERWRVAARRDGADEVRTLAPFEGDACELAALDGRVRLGRRLLAAMFPADQRPAARGEDHDRQLDVHLLPGMLR